MEDESIREKRRKKILERLQKESNLEVEEELKESQITTKGLSAHEKYKILKKTEKEEVCNSQELFIFISNRKHTNFILLFWQLFWEYYQIT